MRASRRSDLRGCARRRLGIPESRQALGACASRRHQARIRTRCRGRGLRELRLPLLGAQALARETARDPDLGRRSAEELLAPAGTDALANLPFGRNPRLRLRRANRGRARDRRIAHLLQTRRSPYLGQGFARSAHAHDREFPNGLLDRHAFNRVGVA